MPGTRPGMTSGEAALQKRHSPINPSETIMGDQWAKPPRFGNAYALP
jgi:hypothetical protein